MVKKIVKSLILIALTLVGTISNAVYIVTDSTGVAMCAFILSVIFLMFPLIYGYITIIKEFIEE